MEPPLTAATAHHEVDVHSSTARLSNVGATPATSSKQTGGSTSEDLQQPAVTDPQPAAVTERMLGTEPKVEPEEPRSASPPVLNRSRSSSHEDATPAGEQLNRCSRSASIPTAQDGADQDGRGILGHLPGRSSAGNLTTAEESEAYLKKARGYIESLGGEFNEQDWTVTISVRTSGASAGSHDRYLHAPDGTRLRSLPELARHLGLIRDGTPTVHPEAPAPMLSSVSNRERRPVNRLVASEEQDQPQLASRKSGASSAGGKREFVDPEELMEGPRRRKLPNGAWIKLPPRRAMLGTALSSMDGIPDGSVIDDGRSESEGDIPAKHSGPVMADGPPSARLGISDDLQIPVICGGKEGLLFYPSRTVLCSCSDCMRKSVEERTMRCTAFETHGGRGSAKKWMDSVLVMAPDTTELCGKPLPKVKVYLKAKGVDLSKPDSSRAGKPAAADGTGAKHPAGGPPSKSSSEARKLVQWAIRRRRSNASPDELHPSDPASAAALGNGVHRARPPGGARLGVAVPPPPGLQSPPRGLPAAGPMLLAGQLPDSSLQAAMQQTERLARAHNLPASRMPASGPASRFASRDPRISSPPPLNLTASRHTLGLTRQPASPGHGLTLSPATKAVSDLLAAEVRQTAGASEPETASLSTSRTRVDDLMQTLAQALVDDRAAADTLRVHDLADLQARHDEQVVDLLASVQRLNARVSELEDNNASLLRALKDAQAGRSRLEHAQVTASPTSQHVGPGSSPFSNGALPPGSAQMSPAAMQAHPAAPVDGTSNLLPVPNGVSKGAQAPMVHASVLASQPPFVPSHSASNKVTGTEVAQYTSSAPPSTSAGSLSAPKQPYPWPAAHTVQPTMRPVPQH